MSVIVLIYTTINFTRLSVVSVTVGVVDTRLAGATLSGTGARVYTAHGLAGRGDGGRSSTFKALSVLILKVDRAALDLPVHVSQAVVGYS